jgi:hypothetical protein
MSGPIRRNNGTEATGRSSSPFVAFVGDAANTVSGLATAVFICVEVNIILYCASTNSFCLFVLPMLLLLLLYYCGMYRCMYVCTCIGTVL